ncbi:MAG: T9SS type A sorting domain-containing protein [Bacteroidota bacterium]
MKYYFIILSLILFIFMYSNPVLAQGSWYEYDNCGNRYLRYTVFLQNAPATNSNDSTSSYDIERNTPGINSFKVKIQPNPTSDFVQIINNSGSEKVLWDFVLNDLNGKQLFWGESSLSDYSIDFSKYESGIYFLRISTEKKTFTWKIIKN